MAEETLGPGGAAAVSAVGVEVGDDAGIEPDNLAFCLEALLGAAAVSAAPGRSITRLPGRRPAAGLPGGGRWPSGRLRCASG